MNSLNVSGRLIPYWEFLSELKNVELHLDVGCDRGDLTLVVHSWLEPCATHGVDVNESSISYANSVHASSNESLKFYSNIKDLDQNRYELVTAFEVLEHVSDEKGFLEFINSKLERDGQLVLSVPHSGLFDFLDPFNYRFLIPKSIFRAVYKMVKGQYPVFDDRPKHKHFSKNELFDLIEKSGFEILKHKRYGFLFFYLKWIYSDLFDKRFNSSRVYKFVWIILNWLQDFEMRRSFSIFSAGILIQARKK